ncbi:unnamed protein product, partial [Prorocentrum cordatum]
HRAACGELHALRARWSGPTRPRMDCRLEDCIGLGMTAARSLHALGADHVHRLESCRTVAVCASRRVQAAVRHGAPIAGAPALCRGFVREATREHPASARAV